MYNFNAVVSPPQITTDYATGGSQTKCILSTVFGTFEGSKVWITVVICGPKPWTRESWSIQNRIHGITSSRSLPPQQISHICPCFKKKKTCTAENLRYTDGLETKRPHSELLKVQKYTMYSKYRTTHPPKPEVTGFHFILH